MQMSPGNVAQMKFYANTDLKKLEGTLDAAVLYAKRMTIYGPFQVMTLVGCATRVPIAALIKGICTGDVLSDILKLISCAKNGWRI